MPKHIPEMCRICNTKSGQTLRAEHVFGGQEHHGFWRCYHCDAVYLFPALSEEEEAHFYRKEFEKFMSDRSGSTSWEKPEAHIQLNLETVNRRWPFLAQHVTPGKRVLEIGCSSGFMLDRMREEGMLCTGIEPSGVFSEYLCAKGYEAYCSLEEYLEKTPDSFDLIMHFFVFEHIRNPFEFLSRTYALLKPGGVMVAEIPCVNDPLTSLYTIPAFERFYWSIAHHYYYSPDCLRWIMNELNMRYELVPEQRYDLSNHMTWMMEGKAGGQGRYDAIFSDTLKQAYRSSLMDAWQCDSMFLYIYK